jgi:hypothetical protein
MRPGLSPTPSLQKVREVLGLAQQPQLHTERLKLNVSELIGECQKEYAKKIERLHAEHDQLAAELVSARRDIATLRSDNASLSLALNRKQLDIDNLRESNACEADRVREECWKKYMERIDFLLRNINSQGFKAVGERVI